MSGIGDTIRSFFTSEMLSPHGICLLWRPELLWTHAISDIVIGIAYFSIPAALGVFLYHRRDVRFSWAAWMFVAFIMLCGVTHFMMVWTLWNAHYGVEALIKALTAIVSAVTAVALWPLLPKVVKLPSPATLEARIAERDAALEQLRQAMADMVAMEEHQRRQKLLLDELNHRVKNTLTTVQAIAMQTFSRTEDVAEFRETFTDRLMTLSRTHNLLVKESWTRVRLRPLADEVLSVFGRAYTYRGVDLDLQPNAAVVMGMALHELATNALKYGAWSRDGTVGIEVAASADGELTMTWTELGGPTVKTPERTGFGARLLERGIASELQALVKLKYKPSGLVCRIVIPTSEQVRPVQEQID